MDYARALDFFDERILSGQNRGKRYIMNLMVAGANKTFKYRNPGITFQFTKVLISDIEEMQSKDRKIIVTKFNDELGIEPKSEIKKIDPMEEDISVLNFTNFITNLLKSNGYLSPSDLNTVIEEDLKQIRMIGNIKAKMIKLRVQEYISDNFI